MLAALSELDESTADVQCMQALSSTAERLSACMNSGAQLSRHLLCQVCNTACVISARSHATFPSFAPHSASGASRCFGQAASSEH